MLQTVSSIPRRIIQLSFLRWSTDCCSILFRSDSFYLLPFNSNGVHLRREPSAIERTCPRPRFEQVYCGLGGRDQAKSRISVKLVVLCNSLGVSNQFSKVSATWVESSTKCLYTAGGTVVFIIRGLRATGFSEFRYGHMSTT